MEDKRAQPFFSIIVPCKNCVATIERTIQSVLLQQVDFQLLILDGASTDGTLDLITKYQDDPRITIDSRKDAGIYSAINRGLELAKGEYVGVLNADDAYTDKALLHIKEVLREGSDFCYGPVGWLNPKSSEKIRISPIPYDEWTRKGLQQMPTPHVGVFVKRRIYKELGGYQEKWKIAADHEFMLRLASHGCNGKPYDFESAEIYAGGISAGSKAKWESMLVAVQYGRSPFIGGLCFLNQWLQSIILQIIPLGIILDWKRDSRFHFKGDGKKCN